MITALVFWEGTHMRIIITRCPEPKNRQFVTDIFSYHNLGQVRILNRTVCGPKLI